MQPSTSLAKANGRGLAESIIDGLMAEPDFLPAMRAVISDGIRAKSFSYDIASKTWLERPDMKSRIESWKLAMSYAEGLPLQRIMQQTLVETRGDLHDALRESPQLLAAVEREVEKAKFRRRHVKQAAPVELEAP